jgi:hypothetical protein
MNQPASGIDVRRMPEIADECHTVSEMQRPLMPPNFDCPGNDMCFDSRRQPPEQRGLFGRVSDDKIGLPNRQEPPARA